MIRSLYDQLVRHIGHLRGLIGRSDGQALIEFALIVSVLSVLALGTVSVAGSSVRAVLGNISGSVTGSQLGQTTTGQTATMPTPPAGKKKKKG